MVDKKTECLCNYEYKKELSKTWFFSALKHKKNEDYGSRAIATKTAWMLRRHSREWLDLSLNYENK